MGIKQPVKKFVPDKRTIYHVPYQDMSKLICEVYDVPEYNIPFNEEKSNDSAIEVDLSAEDTLTCDDLKEIAHFRKAKGWRGYVLLTLLTHMAHNGIIPFGEYVISIWW